MEQLEQLRLRCFSRSQDLLVPWFETIPQTAPLDREAHSTACSMCVHVHIRVPYITDPQRCGCCKHWGLACATLGNTEWVVLLQLVHIKVAKELETRGIRVAVSVQRASPCPT